MNTHTLFFSLFPVHCILKLLNVCVHLKVVPPKPSSSASRSKALSKFKMLEKFHKDKKDSYLNKEEESIASDSPDNLEGNKITVFHMISKRKLLNSVSRGHITNNRSKCLSSYLGLSPAYFCS